jgi:hypothetical protein
MFFIRRSVRGFSNKMILKTIFNTKIKTLFFHKFLFFKLISINYINHPKVLRAVGA